MRMWWWYLMNRVIFYIEEEKDGMVVLDCRPGDGQEVKRRGGRGRDPRGFQSFWWGGKQKNADVKSKMFWILFVFLWCSLGCPKKRLNFCMPLTFVTFPNHREGVSSINSQTFSNKTFLSKRFRYWVFFPFKQSDCVLLNRVWFGLLVSFWFFQTWSKV